jgi:hypothetical protein
MPLLAPSVQGRSPQMMNVGKGTAFKDCPEATLRAT